jgi:hypothetical protein
VQDLALDSHESLAPRRRRKNSDAAEVSAAARRRLLWGGTPPPHVTGRLRPLSLMRQGITIVSEVTTVSQRKIKKMSVLMNVVHAVSM